MTDITRRAITTLFIAVAILSACAPRSDWMPLSPGEQALAYGVPGSENRSGLPVSAKPGPAIAFSGGGQKGAYGAGLMVGWTERGDRPEFSVVTGVSTGAILALFTFLGPEYDNTVEMLYTRYQTRDLLRRNYVGGLLGGNALDNAAPYRSLIDQHVNDAIVGEIAAEARRGRTLLIGSTDLDGKRPYLWDVTKIAASGHPNRGQLIRDIIQASSAIPAIFPPVIIPFVDASGRSGDQLHVDGGMTRPFVFRPLTAPDSTRSSSVFIVANEYIDPGFEPVEPNLRNVASAAVETAVTTAIRDEIALFAEAASRTGIQWRGTTIPDNFTLQPNQQFDPEYMRQLFELGRTSIITDRSWTQNANNVQNLR
ncbi:hypothetical protein BMG03_20120 (plasmid) [Thioclava nitratireducens]|uniref:PNPLA domain-containing protein n=1 Tax=Thioclava nitratireducens TaxID=1915078 RepID=A0ABM6IN18_9RHOB|nr:patatin-like phospholipase family protein [Thioclava nitratireducens]AQS50219.1 hypothetical protein BMG03_20120 [Thioclava nitratireducens]